MNTIWKFLIRFRRFLGWYKPYQTVKLEDMPDYAEVETLYLVGEEGQYWFAAMRCPCGCKSIIKLSLLPTDRPRWIVEQHNNETVSLYPSVWRKVGCNSHFWFKNGVVHWCKG